MKYDVDYFIRKFKAIPEDKWCVQDYEREGKHCAMGHCGARQGFGSTEESNALENILDWVLHINDGDTSAYTQKTPKKRILAALQDIKKRQGKEPKIVIKYVAVPETINEQAKNLILS